MYDYVAAFGMFSLSIESGFASPDIIVLCLYTWWEVIPATILLVLFWSVGKTHKTITIGSVAAPKHDDDFVMEGEGKSIQEEPERTF